VTSKTSSPTLVKEPPIGTCRDCDLIRAEDMAFQEGRRTFPAGFCRESCEPWGPVNIDLGGQAKDKYSVTAGHRPWSKRILDNIVGGTHIN